MLTKFRNLGFWNTVLRGDLDQFASPREVQAVLHPSDACFSPQVQLENKRLRIPTDRRSEHALVHELRVAGEAFVAARTPHGSVDINAAAVTGTSPKYFLGLPLRPLQLPLATVTFRGGHTLTVSEPEDVISAKIRTAARMRPALT